MKCFTSEFRVQIFFVHTVKVRGVQWCLNTFFKISSLAYLIRKKKPDLDSYK